MNTFILCDVFINVFYLHNAKHIFCSRNIDSLNRILKVLEMRCVVWKEINEKWKMRNHRTQFVYKGKQVHAVDKTEL